MPHSDLDAPLGRPPAARPGLAGTRLLLAASALVAWGIPEAAAHPFDTWGFTSRAAAMASAGTATATDLDATYYNPAAIGRTRHLVIGLGLLVADDFLQVDGEDAGIDTHVLFQVGLAAPLPLGEVMRDRLFLSLALALPHTGLFDVRQPDDRAVVFPFWDSRNRRLVLTAALAGRVFDWLYLGIGTALLPDVVGDVRLSLNPNATDGDNSVRVKVDYDFAPTAGVLVEPLEWLAVGVTYRGEHATEVDLPVVADVGYPVPARVIAPAYALPHEVAMGVQVRPLEGLLATYDLTWYGYSSFRYSSPDLLLLDAGGDVSTERRAATQRMSDVWAHRLGAEWQALEWLVARAGYAWIPSPVPPQTGVTNLMDADRSVVSLGLGFDLPGRWLWTGVRRMSIDLHAQVHVLSERTFAKDAVMVGKPGYPTIGVSGGTFSAGLSLRLWLGGDEPCGTSCEQ